jgi:peroxiredoxin (alkyl hydroperoxide reductase subunit C)
MVPPPATAKDAEARARAGYEYTDWYFSKTDIPQAVPKKKKRGTR